MFYILSDMKQDRKELVNTIVNDAQSYKVCTVCGNIADREATVCPDCHAYRFNDDAKAVADQALNLVAEPPTVISRFDLEFDA